MKFKKSLILRIDDRLIHGQVLVGWATHFRLKKLVVANDAIAANDWETNMMLVNATGSLQVEVSNLSNAVADYGQNHIYSPFQSSRPIEMVLMNSLQDLREIHNKGLPPSPVNLGGIHYQAGRVEFLPYLFLTEKEKQLLIEMRGNGFSFYCQDIPQKDAVAVSKILEG